MKYLILLPALLMITACSTIADYLPSISKPSCYERIAVIEIAVDRAYKSVGDLVQGDLITADAAEKSITAIDSADAAAESASPLCAIDEPAASDYLDLASEFLNRVNQITSTQE